MLRIENLTKTFGAEKALKSIDMEIASGEIHGLVGVNGSGKSTLLNVLFGSPVIWQTGGYSGAIYVHDRKVEITGPAQAMKHGIGMIHQELAFIPGLTVWENILMGREKVHPFTERLFGKAFSCIDRRRSRMEAGRILQRLGIEMDPAARASDLSVSLKQFVEIAREVSNPALEVLLLDEPTAALNKEDSGELHAILRELAGKGVAVLYVSHRLDEVVSLCDRITVLRDGEVAAVFPESAFDIEAITESMIGRQVVRARRRADKNTNGRRSMVRLENFCADMPGETLHRVSLDVYKGEIFGVTGLSGHGKLAVGHGIMGLCSSRGEVFLKGEPLRHLEASHVLEKGVSFLPEDRRAMGLLLSHSVVDNIIFTAVQSRHRFLKQSPFAPLRFVDRRKAVEYAEECVERFQIKCTSVLQKVKELSGGNQQKVCIARSLAIDPEILLVSEPTRGIDVGAKELILDMLVGINERLGTTVLMASSELDELKRICDRIAVLYKGAVFDVLPPDCDERVLALHCHGEREGPPWAEA